MARAGRTGGVDAAREIVSVIGALSTEGDEVNPGAIASRMGKTPEETSKFMDMLLYLGTDDVGLKLCAEFDDDDTPYFVDSAAGRPLRLTKAETLAVQAALAWMGTPEDDPLAAPPEAPVHMPSHASLPCALSTGSPEPRPTRCAWCKTQGFGRRTAAGT